jgi:hypothetical protein
MGLKHTITKLEDVPENVRTLYVAQGDKFVLDVDGVVPKEKLDEFRNNNIALQQQIDKYKDLDPVKYRELMAIQQKITEKELLDKGEVEKLVELRVTTMRDDHDLQDGSRNGQGPTRRSADRQRDQIRCHQAGRHS